MKNSTNTFWSQWNDDSARKLEVELYRKIQPLIEAGGSLVLSVEKKHNLNTGRPATLTLTSNDLAEGMRPKMFESLKVEHFSSQLVDDPSDEEAVYWMTISFRYRHFDGGCNGSDIGTVWIKSDGSIKDFRPSGNR